MILLIFSLFYPPFYLPFMVFFLPFSSFSSHSSNLHCIYHGSISCTVSLWRCCCLSSPSSLALPRTPMTASSDSPYFSIFVFFKCVSLNASIIDNFAKEAFVFLPHTWKKSFCNKLVMGICKFLNMHMMLMTVHVLQLIRLG